MGRKSSKKSVSFEEPEKKRAKLQAQQKNAAELKELLASQTSDGLELGPNGHIFVDQAVPAIAKEKSAGGVTKKGGKTAPIDPLGGADPKMVAGNNQSEAAVEPPAKLLADPLADSEQTEDQHPVTNDSSDDESDADSKDDEEPAEDSVGFPMPIKEDSDIEEKHEELTQQQNNEPRTPKEPKPKDRSKPTYDDLLDSISDQREVIQQLRTKCAALQVKSISLKNLAVRLTEENMALKDSRGIPQAKFTTVRGINVTVAELDAISLTADTTAKFVGLLVIKLVGVERLCKMSVTGKPCQRFRNVRNPDGTPTHPAQQKLDPKIFSFVCDKVAERTAIRHGPANVVLIRAESNEPKIRAIIATKIANLKKSKRCQAAQEAALESSGSDSEKDEEEPTQQ